MMLFLAIAALLATLATGFMIAMANGMSDVGYHLPGSSITYIPFWIGVVITLILWVFWFKGWHPSW